jgi:hypothetical protein
VLVEIGRNGICAAFALESVRLYGSEAAGEIPRAFNSLQAWAQDLTSRDDM